MNQPLISICIPAYNAAPFIEEAIKGWTSQTYSNIEIIVQDDSSTDDTYFLAKELAKIDTRIKVFRNNINFGIGKNWNEAHNKATGDYICIFNADDLILPNFLSRALEKFIIYQEISFVCCSAMRRDKTLKQDLWDPLIFKGMEGVFEDFTKTGDSKNRLLAWQFTLAKRSSFETLKENDNLFYPTQCCDADLWLRVHEKKLKAYYIEDISGYYRTHKGNNSSLLFGEFESTFKDLVLRHPWYFKSKFFVNPLKKIKTLLYYIYKNLISGRKINHYVVINYVKFNFKFK